jgi:Ricin-type beta-trefoil lectin domain-like
MPTHHLGRGATPTPRHLLAAATPFRVAAGKRAGAPPSFIVKPAQLSFWGNYNHGDCVSAEEAFAKSCHNQEIFIPEQDLINWASAHGVLEGAQLPQILQFMQSDGFKEGTLTYDDGPYYSVDWTNPVTLESAISTGPVKIGVAGDQLETVWWAAGSSQAGGKTWFGTGFHSDATEDHCVSLCGYGTIAWLAQQLHVGVPAGVNGDGQAYALFTWDSIGIIDQPSLLAITHEAWIRTPTTVTVPIQSPYYHLQVKHSGQYLNILNASLNNGAEACQGVNDATPNFAWQILPEAGGYFVLRVKSSGQYLNILNASLNNGAMACQGVNDSTPNFLWQFVSLSGAVLPGIPTPGTEFHLKVKSSGQYLNILNAATNNGAEACQGVNNTTPNFVWKLEPTV